MLAAKIQSASVKSADRITQKRRLAYLPRRILWAWEKPEDLLSINTENTGVALLTGVLRLQGDCLQLNRRTQRLAVSNLAKTIAVVRIECDESRPPTLSKNQRQELVHKISEAVSRHHANAVQIDFDAKLTERDFYKEMLKDLRNALPAEKGISITALASWCFDDRWLSSLPVDEVVPMYFYMGADEQIILKRLKKGFVPYGEHEATGLLANGTVTKAAAVDRKLRSRLCKQRVYLFCARSWTRQAIDQTMTELYAWR